MLGRSILGWAWLFLAGAAWLISPFSSTGNPAEEHAKLALISEQAAILPDQQLWMGVQFDLEEGWHTYWINPGLG